MTTFSRLAPVSGAKAPIFTITGHEIARRCGPPEYMKSSALARVVNKDRGLLSKWFDSVIEYITKPEVGEAEYMKGSSRHHRYTFFTNLCEGKTRNIKVS